MFLQKPHALYLSDMTYQPFYPSEELPWVKKAEAAADAIETELTAFLASPKQAFAPCIHDGVELLGQAPETLKEHDNSADDRIALFFDVWHPDLTEQERRDITSLLQAMSA